VNFQLERCITGRCLYLTEIEDPKDLKTLWKTVSKNSLQDPPPLGSCFLPYAYASVLSSALPPNLHLLCVFFPQDHIVHHIISFAVPSLCIDSTGRSEVTTMGQEDERWVLTKTARAPSNIAVIKYWGKRDEKLILPINSSISITLDPEHLSATTTVAASPAFESDRLWLNGKVSGCVLSSSPA
jgi:hypothetical protein